MKYLFDTNIFITAKDNYYATDIAPSFWLQLEKFIRCGNVIVIDMVYNEMTKKRDELANWISKACNNRVLSSDNEKIRKKYNEIITGISASDEYFTRAKEEFASVADSWILAHAYNDDYCVITNETYDPNIKRKIKIPNACKLFHVSYANLFEFMRRESLILQ